MSDSGRQIGDCAHGKTPEFCVECLRAALEKIAKLDPFANHHDAHPAWVIARKALKMAH